jgi:hypothetical protein
MLLVWVGKADEKRWWRNLDPPADVRFTLRGKPGTGRARVVRGLSESAAAYVAANPKPVRRAGGIDPDTVMVEIEPTDA